MDGTSEDNKPRGRAARREAREQEHTSKALMDRVQGGSYKPFSDRDIERIHHTVLDILENIGMAEPIPVLLEHALPKGCTLDDKGRLRFPRALVEDVINAAPKSVTYHAKAPELDNELSDNKLYFDPGGESVNTLDFETGKYRPSTLVDLYDFGRLVDRLDHIDSFGKVVVPTEISDHFLHDINAAYATAAATQKHISIGFTEAKYIDAALEMLYIIAGGEEKYNERPFCSSGGCPVVSPLTYGFDNADVCVEAVRFNAPVSVIVAPQSGATSPAALAGSIVQSTAETMAALLLVNLVHPGHPVVFGSWPFVSDLRTGSFSGGSGEQALLAAGAMQVANYYGLPTSTGAGMSDSKIPDNQAGFEKGITTLLSAMAGGNSISEVCGMTASLMGCSFEAMMIDNEMLGTIKRVIRGIEVTDETLSYQAIKDVVDGPGHFLGHEQTLEMMETEYLYPELADRNAPYYWEEQGSVDMLENARVQAKAILSTHYPDYIGPEADRKIRERFPIHLPKEAMKVSERW
ncbi:MAG: trimethylamine methyltransferase [Rhodospirillales bacterium]|nr:trimethylamine methyltransferase [Rhodospirillales bacterium]